MEDAVAIWNAIRAANAAWVRGDAAGTAPLFADDAVMILPGARGRVDGRDAIVKSFVDYCANARTVAFEEGAHEVAVRGERAFATYAFAVRYELDGKLFDEEGQEVLVFERAGGAWRAVWRTQIVTASKSGRARRATLPAR